jgi:hypothetical protein
MTDTATTTKTPDDYAKEIDDIVAMLEKETGPDLKAFVEHADDFYRALADAEKQMVELDVEIKMLDSDAPPGTEEEMKVLVQQLEAEVE